MRLPIVLGANMAEYKRLHPVSLQINEQMIPLSNATMSVTKDEEIEGRTYVKLFTPNGKCEIYRTRVPEVTHGGAVSTIQLDHAVCEVGDYVIQDAIKAEKTVLQAFVTIFSHYRGSLWQLGTFTAPETVTLDCDYDNVLETMLAILEQVPKYMMTFDFSTTPWTLGVAQKSNTVSAEGRLARNVRSAIVRRDDKDLCTRVFVKGLPKPAGREEDENAIGYMDADTISLYGVVEKETGGTNLTEAQATRVATEYLASHKHPKLSVEIDADDLYEITGETLDALIIGKKYRLVIAEKNIVIEDYITRISWTDAINNPQQANIVIGEQQDATLNFFQDQASGKKSSRRGAKKQAKTDDKFEKNFAKTDEYGAILEQAGMKLDSHGLIVYARDNVNNIGSIIDLTAAGLTAEFQQGDAQLRGAIITTASELRTEYTNGINGVSSRVTQQAGMWEALVEGTGQNMHIKPAQIQATLDAATGQSKIVLSASNIIIDGNLLAQSIRGLDITVTGLTTTYLNVEGTTSVPDNGYVGLSSSGNAARWKDILVEAYVSGNILHIIDLAGNDTTFSKATSLSGAWSGNTFTVTASPQGNTISTQTFVSTPDWTYDPNDPNKAKVSFYYFDNGDRVEILPAVVNAVGRYDAGIAFQTGKMVPFIGNQSNETYNGKITTITSNGTYYACAEGYKSHDEGYDNSHYSSDRYASAVAFTVDVPGATHNPTIDSVYTSQNIPSGGTELNSLKTQYENAKEDGDNFCIRVNCNGVKHTYYCTP